LIEQRVYPRVEQGLLKTWIAVGGSPDSVVRAASFGLPLMLAIIGGSADRFVGYAELHRRALEEFEKPAQPMGVHSPGYVAATDAQARDEFWPDYKRMHDRIGRERGWPPLGRSAFEREIAQGSLYVGSPETVARKIASTVKTLGLSRFDLKYSAGPLSHDRLMRCIEHYGRTVIPMVRELLI
jgi:alkanesulfonate monooxygenase SsuD/methylene tetrahydromethanopterin reductase-like flavin-dependent oxidoreductase (luciferase family)